MLFHVGSSGGTAGRGVVWRGKAGGSRMQFTSRRKTPRTAALLRTTTKQSNPSRARDAREDEIPVSLRNPRLLDFATR